MALRRGVLGAVLVAIVAVAAPARASFDIAEVYLRKVKVGERTYFADGGWRRTRVRLDLSYETDVLPEAGVADPRGVSPAVSGSPLTASSLGAMLLLTARDSPYQLLAFTLTMKNFVASSDVAGQMPIGFILMPSLARDDGYDGVSQQLTGAQLRLGTWLEATYGVISEKAPSTGYVFRNFVEYNVPDLFLRNSQVLARNGETVRQQNAIRYDRASWMNYAELGRVQQRWAESRTFYYLDADQLWRWLSAEVRVTDDLRFAYARGGLHYSSAPRARQGGKFGSAVDLRLYGTAVDPLAASQWSLATGTSTDDLAKTRYGGAAEITVQAPALTILGFVTLLLSVQAQALTGDESYGRRGADAFEQALDASHEDDSVYAAITASVSYNDPELLREVPGAIDQLRIGLFFRLIY